MRIESHEDGPARDARHGVGDARQRRNQRGSRGSAGWVAKPPQTGGARAQRGVCQRMGASADAASGTGPPRAGWSPRAPRGVAAISGPGPSSGRRRSVEATGATGAAMANRRAGASGASQGAAGALARTPGAARAPAETPAALASRMARREIAAAASPAGRKRQARWRATAAGALRASHLPTPQHSAFTAEVYGAFAIVPAAGSCPRRPPPPSRVREPMAGAAATRHPRQRPSPPRSPPAGRV